MPLILTLRQPLLLLLPILLQIQLVAGTHLSSVTYANHTAIQAAPCRPEEESALLHLKQSFVSTTYSAIAFRSWRPGTDCCHWEGIHCGEADGHVTSLDLGDCNLESGHLDPAVFELTSLRYLNLALNDFNKSVLPASGFENLAKLTYLNLSTSNFGGQVPHGIGRLANLVSLDISNRFFVQDILGVGFRVMPFFKQWELTVKNFTTLVAYLGTLRELHLGFVDLSQSIEWCNALAKYTPNLRVLSLPFCYLPGPICGSLSALQSLSMIDLRFNAMTGPFPSFFANFPSLSVLGLSHNHFEGWVSPAIFEHKKLATLLLDYNPKISCTLPNFSSDNRLQYLLVGNTNFSGAIPSSISKAKSLKILGLNARGFSGNLPSSIGELTSLKELMVSGTDLVGPIPSWITNLTSLELLQFSYCGLHGPIPSSIGDLINLRILAIYHCRASGDIPPHILNITQLQELVLGSNNFSGKVELNSLWRQLPNLEYLDLSNNKIIVVDGEDNTSMVSFPNIIYLKLASCSITKFPSILRHLNVTGGLDLSNNQIHGAIPKWAWEKWAGTGLFFLHLSHNKFTSIGFDSFLPFYIEVLDLSFNMFQGPIPIPQNSGALLDYSSNMFSSIPLNISTQLQGAKVFKASLNNLSGSIPTSFCKTNIEFLDLSYNFLSGSIPSCLMEGASTLKILNMKENHLQGELPQTVNGSCMLEVLDISNNRFEGKLPRSIVACKRLEVLDIGHNHISDSFPCWTSALPRLEVLVLNSNKLFGQVEPSNSEDKNSCTFPSLRILDMASNNFSGTLPEAWLMKLESMMVKVNNETLVMEYRADEGDAYQVATVLTYKGSEITIKKVLRTLVFLDVSNNVFQGSISAAIGELVLLNMLNLSHNTFTGPIPLQLSQLNQLESLDVSSNQLSGKIPEGLASLDFLTTLNLSYNKLVGSIPESPHFMTFTNSSFLGNDGLCGPPLSKECFNMTPPIFIHLKKKSTDIMLFLFAGLGFGVGFAIAIVMAWGIPMKKRS